MSERFPVTLFKDKAAATKKECRVTVEELAGLIRSAEAETKDELPLLKLGQFGDQRTGQNCLRHDDNVLSVSGVETDYDLGVVPFEEVVKRVRKAGVKAILYTSPSYSPEKPKWRALFPFAETRPPAARAAMVNRAHALLDAALAGESWNLSQSYYYGKVNGHFRLEVTDGETIDARPDIPERGKPPKKAPISAATMRAVKTGDAKNYRSRSELVWHVACSCARAGWGEEEIAALLIDKANRISEHVYDQRSDPREYARKQAKNAREEVAGEAKEVTDSVARLNAEYAVLNSGKVTILREYDDGTDGLSAFSLMRPADFKLWLANQPPVMVSEKAVPVADFWLRHPSRRQYSGIDFMPGVARGDWYNLWTGFAIAPKEGDCGLFLAHLRDNVAQGNEKIYWWVIGWLADIVQNPARKSGTSLVLTGEQGVGKTIVGKTMRRLLGRHYVLATRSRYITGQFNAHLLSCLLLHAEEAFWAGDKAAEGVLKDLVTGDRHLMEFKYCDAIQVMNYVRLLVSSNSDWVVPAGMEERRFAVLKVGDARRQDHAYFAAIDEQLDDGGAAALLDYLLKFDLSTVDVSVIPKTAELLSQKIESLDPIKGWWLTTLHEGQLPGGCDAENTCPAGALYQGYLDHAAMTHVRSPRASPTAFGIALGKLMPVGKGGKPKKRKKRDSYCTHADGQPRYGYVYELAPLLECRNRFEELAGQPIEWEEVEPAEQDFTQEFPRDRGVEGAENWDKAPLPWEKPEERSRKEEDPPYPP